jgi:hypothetical protein
MAHTVRSVAWSIAGIIASGIVGAVAGRELAIALGLDGLAAALVAATCAMVVATAVWIALTVVLRRIGLVR